MNEYLHNQGSSPVGIRQLQRQINNGILAVYKITQTNVEDVFRDIIIKKNKSEFLFVLSREKGLRILERPSFYHHLANNEFHHQNIFQNNVDILTAGTIHTQNSKIIFTNMSGHYRPHVESLQHLNSLLRKYNLSVNYKIVNYSDIGQLTSQPSVMQRIINLLPCINNVS
ncbi:TPA: hypothetical protein ACQ39K_004890 [Yersinia enterocolitica]